MPSPIGHLIAGATIGLAADHGRHLSTRWPRILVISAFLAAAPALDLIYPDGHRKMTHSLLAVGLVLLTAMLVTRLRARRIDWLASITCTLAYGSHLLTDYFGVDPGTPSGIQLLWPWNERWFISEWSLFLGTERHDPFGIFAITMNTLALGRELLILAPCLLLVLVRRRRMEKAAQTTPTASTSVATRRVGEPFADTGE